MKVSATSVGKGFQGTIKRHDFGRGPVSHGSHNVRAPGSIGASADPARVFKGTKMPGRMGGKRVTQRGLEVVEVDAERHLLLIRGAVPGPRAGPWRCAAMASAAKALKATMLGKQAKTDLPGTVFGEEFHETLVHEAARADLTARRRGTASTLGRGEVSMTTAKAWNQKGTGRARVGALSVPHRRGGGVAFGPKPRSHTFKVNRKARRRALRSAFSVHAARDSIAVIDAAAYETPSTKTAAAALAKWGPKGPTLILCDAEETGVLKSFRNIPSVDVLPVGSVGVADVIGHASLVVTQAALETLEGRVGDVERAPKPEEEG